MEKYGSEIFPLNSEQVPEEDLIPGPRGYNIRMCRVCGAGVLVSGKQLHINWHNKSLVGFNIKDHTAYHENRGEDDK